ncbi:MAG: hypothetical protein AVDCRST_MAG59-4348, partial [uncultured Thermomicrobiales bacterium]
CRPRPPPPRQLDIRVTSVSARPRNHAGGVGGVGVLGVLGRAPDAASTRPASESGEIRRRKPRPIAPSTI